MSSDEVSLDRPRPVTPWLEHARALLAWIGVGRIVAIGLSVAAVGAGGYWLLRAPAPPVEASLPMATTSTAPDATAARGGGDHAGSPTTGAGTLVVHVAGAVADPGVYRLADGSRVVDALAAAGGPAIDADLDALNLAAVAGDGQQVYVPRVGEPPGGGAAAGAAAAPTFPLDVNRADAEALDALPGIGPATAAAIIAHREAHGPFASVDELLDVRGIGPAKLEALRPLLRV